MDTLSPDERSRLMASIRAANTKPELAVRSLIHRLGFRFRLHRRDLPGKPDIVLPRHRRIIQVHGCFWHGCPRKGCRKAHIPKSNTDYWLPKLARNRDRDRKNRRELVRLGWRVLIVWECETASPERLMRRVLRFLEAPRHEDSRKRNAGES